MVGVSLDDLEVEFGGFNINIDEQGGPRLIELCDKFALSAEDVFNQWMAYASSGKKAETKTLTLDVLGPFEVWMGQTTTKSAAAVHSTPKAVKKEPRVTSTPSRNPFGVLNAIKLEDELDADIDIASGYTTPQNRDKLAKRLHTTPEDDGLHKRLISENGSPHMARPPKVELFRGDILSGSPSSPMTPSQNYRSRTNKGNVVDSLNCDAAFSFPPRTAEVGIPPLIGVIDSSSGQLLPQPLASSFKYMMQRPTEVADIIDNAVDELLETLLASDVGVGKENGEKEKEDDANSVGSLEHVGVPHHERVRVGGRICCDGIGRLNAKSLLLEGTRDSSGGATVALDVSQLPRYSFFPGQTVLAEGTNPSGKSFIPSRLVSAAPAEAKPAAVHLVEDISIFVAAGPFTTADSDAYEPLEDFLNLVKEQRPHVCILLGPFIDAKNELIVNNSFQAGDGSYEGLFAMILDRVGMCMDSMGGCCQAVIVPSARDVHHAYVYPQPPFPCEGNQRIKSFWDPSLLSIGGLLVGATSTDILFHLGAEEISYPPGSSDRLARLCSHILAQKSFYPLHPASEDVNMDYSLFERHATLVKKPQVVIIPSELKQFIKDVSGCVCINPGRLAKGKIGGTFTKIFVPANAVSSKTIKSQVIRI